MKQSMTQLVIAFNAAAPTVADLILSGSVFSVLWTSHSTARRCVGFRILRFVYVVIVLQKRLLDRSFRHIWYQYWCVAIKLCLCLLLTYGQVS